MMQETLEFKLICVPNDFSKHYASLSIIEKFLEFWWRFAWAQEKGGSCPVLFKEAYDRMTTSKPPHWQIVWMLVEYLDPKVKVSLTEFVSQQCGISSGEVN